MPLHPIKVMMASESDLHGRITETFSTKAVAKNPRPKWYELSADGLMEAASTVASIGNPVTEA